MNFGFLRPRRVAKHAAKTVANFPGWLSLNFLKEMTVGLIGFISPAYKNYVKPLPGEMKDDRSIRFKEAMAKMNVSESDLVARASNLAKQGLFFVILTFLALVYCVYLLATTAWVAALLSLLVSALFFLRFCTCRYWIFQIKQRKLDCTLREWLAGRVSE